MKNLLLICITLLVSACMATSPTQSYRPKGESNAWEITGTLEHRPFDGLLKISIDKNQVIEGALVRGDGTLTGTYKGLSIESVCHGTDTRTATFRTDCLILVDNEKSVTLTF
jgi:hypothetical protein